MNDKNTKDETLCFNEKYLKRIAKLRLLDDDFMSKVFEDKECVDYCCRLYWKGRI